MRRLVAIARKETLHLLRDPRSLAAALALPVALLVLYGYAVDYDLHRLTFAAVDDDHSPASRRLLTGLDAIDSFEFLGLLDRAEQADGLFERRLAMAVVVVPRGFQDALQSGRSAPVQVLVDGSDGNTAAMTLAYVTGAVREVGRRLVARETAAGGIPRSLTRPGLEVRTRVFYNPELKSKQFLIPGLVAIILTLLASLLTSGVVVRERERGTFELLAASPIAPSELIVGKLLPYLALAAFDVLLTVGLGWALFGVVPQGSLTLLFALSTLFVAAALSLGLFFSCVARTQQLAMLLSFVGTMVPTMLLSGFAFPIRNMPVVLQKLSQVFPATHYIVIARGIILKGSGLRLLGREAALLGVLAVLLVALAVSRFRKRL